MSLPASDSIGPWPLQVRRIGTRQLRAELAAEYAGGEYAQADTINGHFLLLKSIVDAPRLLYRAQAADTSWVELGGLLDYGQEEARQQQELEVRRANLDGKGLPEVLLILSSADYGSGGGFTYTSIFLLDVTTYPPRLLLRAKTGFVAEAFQAYAAMHGDTLADDEVYTGYERTVGLRPHELVVGAIRARGRQPEPLWRSELTQLPAGCYRYQRGRMHRVKN